MVLFFHNYCCSNESSSPSHEAFVKHGSIKSRLVCFQLAESFPMLYPLPPPPPMFCCPTSFQCFFFPPLITSHTHKQTRTHITTWSAFSVYALTLIKNIMHYSVNPNPHHPPTPPPPPNSPKWINKIKFWDHWWFCYSPVSWQPSILYPPPLPLSVNIIFHKWVLGFVPLYHAEWFYHNKSSCYPALISPSDFLLWWTVGRKVFFRWMFLLWYEMWTCTACLNATPSRQMIFEFHRGVNLFFNIPHELCALLRLQHGKFLVHLSFFVSLCFSVSKNVVSLYFLPSSYCLLAVCPSRWGDAEFVSQHESILSLGFGRCYITADT